MPIYTRPDDGAIVIEVGSGDLMIGAGLEEVDRLGHYVIVPAAAPAPVGTASGPAPDPLPPGSIVFRYSNHESLAVVIRELAGVYMQLPGATLRGLWSALPPRMERRRKNGAG